MTEDRSDDVTHRDICVDTSEDKADTKAKGFGEAIKHIGDGLFKNYEDKTAYLSSDAIKGTIGCDLLNSFMKEAYGIDFEVLEEIVKKVKSRRQSKDGYGKDKFIEALTKLSASFDTVEGDGLNNRLPQRRF